MRYLWMLAVLFGALPWSAEAQAVKGVASGNTRFAVDLYKQLSRRPGNLFFSPYSLSNGLAMTYAGARGETADQMARTLHFPVPQDELPAAFAALNKTLDASEAVEGFQLTIANRLWGQQGFDFVPSFLTTLRDRFEAGLTPVDFKLQTEAAREQINTWVAIKTQQRIKDLIPPDAINEDTRLVLTNAIYFKGAWAARFSKESTRDADFHVSSDKTTRVPLMNRTSMCGYWSGDYREPGDDLQLVELAYKNSDFTMVVLLPHAVDGLSALEEKLSAERLDHWLEKLKTENTQVFLPRFKIGSPFSLKDALSALGMPLAFDNDRADFSGVSSGERLYLSAVVHKADISVDEDGTEAAAATGAILTLASLPPDFRGDHPFLFLIRNRKSGAILFLGRVQNPNG